MRVLPVNATLPRIVNAEGRRVKTAIHKRAVASPVMLGRMDPEADGQADLSVHGRLCKAVYVYSWRNIEFWRETFERDDVGSGTLGENLTVEGLFDTEVCIGDELSIGTTRFRVTQPRIPCFKLGIALGTPGFPRLLRYSGSPARKLCQLIDSRNLGRDGCDGGARRDGIGGDSGGHQREC